MDSILAYMLATALSMMGVAGFAAWAKIGVANVKTAATASQLVIFDQAAQQYVRDYALVLGTQATQNIPVTVHTSDLKDYLPAGFSGINPFGQVWQMQVLSLPHGQLQPLVTSQNGAPIRDPKQLVQIAAQVGAAGGFVPYANQGGDPTMNPGNAVGAYGGWTLPLTSYTNPGSGHLASLLTVVNTQSSDNDYLYRVAVPGKTTLNQMQTAIDMNGNNLNNAGRVNAQEVNVQSSSGTSTVNLGAGSVSYANPSQRLTLAAAGGVQIANAAGVPAPLTAGDITGGILQPVTVAIQGNPCQQTGAIARSNVGALFCQSGFWRSIISTYQVANAPTDSCSADDGNGHVSNGVPSVASCPAGTTLTGGGHMLTVWNPAFNTSTNAPDASFPTANTWVVVAGGKSANSCFRAYAICVQ